MNVRLVAFLLVVALSATTRAQAPIEHDPDWGKQQNVKEMLEYWRSWEIAGPDKNVEAARAKGLKQFLAMPRGKHGGQSPQGAIPAWEQMAASQANFVSGRTTDIAFDPDRPDYIFYLGTSGGGLWKTTDAGEHWVAISNSFESYAIGAVAVDQKNGNIVYAATGDLYDRPGDGLYKSEDAGLNWTRIATNGANGIGDRVYQLQINPHNPSTLYVTSSGDSETGYVAGVRISYDGGMTWKSVKNLGGNTTLVVDPTDTNRLYAGGGGVITRSTDGGKTWSGDLADNISDKSTITMAFSPKDSSKVYASIGYPWGTTNGIARSTDFGATWEMRSKPQDDYLGSQSWYCNAAAANPTSPNIVIVGGLDVWASGLGGASPVRKSDWTKQPGINADYCHADIHALKYSPRGKLYAMTDGGIFESSNNSNSWRQSINNDLGTLLFVGADAAPDMSFIIGGCQDNGINRATAAEQDFTQTDGGDGGRVFVAQSDPKIVFATQQQISFKRSANGGLSFANILPDDSPLRSEGTPFYIMYDVCEADANYVAVCGNQHVYYSEDGGINLVKSTKTAIRPTAVHVCSADPYYVYAGTQEDNGYVYTTADPLGGTWQKSTTKIGRGAGFVSDPSNAQIAYAVSAGYGGKNFWKTTDGGKTWTAPTTSLTNFNLQTIARAPNGDLFVGHAFGVLRSMDGGVNWEALRDGLPLADVKKLRVRGDSSQWLIAATYGRSIYKLNIADLPREPKSVKYSADPNFQIQSIVPNPSKGDVELSYRVPSDCKAMITLYDELGREVRTLANEYTPKGDHKLHLRLEGLPSGSYSIVIAAAGKAVTERLVITN